MSAADAITVSGLGKTYRVYDTPLDALKELLLRRPRHREFRALDDVNFAVAPGERVGIVGSNGAGKSTLLRILSGTLDHTAGSFRVNGRLRAVLELGTGFHEECSGRENILMGGLCMGSSRAELLARMDWIIGFSELERVIDQPLRTYSSGMKSRLMYAVAFCTAVEVMIVDEALATGDGAFVRKCTQHIVDLCAGGCTALVVSHNLYFLERLCDRVIWLRGGRLVADGDPLAVCKQYEADLGREFVASVAPLPRAAPASTSPEPVREAFLVAGHDHEDVRATVPGVAAKLSSEVSSEVSAEVSAEASAQAPAEGPLEGLAEELAEGVAEATAGVLAGPEPEENPRSNGTGQMLDADGCWRDIDFTGAPAVCHLLLVRLREAVLLDEHGRPAVQIATGRTARVRLLLESRVRKRDVHVGLMIWNDRNVHVATTTNVCALDGAGRPNRTRLHLTEGLFAVEVAFPALALGAGRYYLKLGVGPGYEHYSNDDLLCSENRCLAFAVTCADHVQDVLYEPPSIWTPLRRLGDLTDAVAAAPAAGRTLQTASGTEPA